MHVFYIKKKTKNMFGYHFVEPIEFGCEWESNCHPFPLEPSMNMTFPLKREVSYSFMVYAEIIKKLRTSWLFNNLYFFFMAH